MSNAIFKLEVPANDPILAYGPGSREKKELKAKIEELKNQKIEIPLIIGGKEIKTGNTGECRIPHDHGHVLAVYHKAGEKEIRMAIDAAKEAWKKWSEMPWEHRLSIFEKMSDLLAGPWRQTINAATMLVQGKNAFQAEVDSACELIDFFRFNTYYAREIYTDQPYSPRGIWNRVEYRPLEGFVFVVTPFNFTSIAGNLPTAPALMGNVVLWKPASSSVFSGYFLMRLFQAAGLPDGVINFLPGKGSEMGDTVMNSPDLAGVHFTGSTKVFQGMWKTVGMNIKNYKAYPRIVGETGGKDFIFAHKTADIDQLVAASVRGAFEYQGQKCSAASRVFVPASLWEEYRDKVIAMTKELKMGTPEDFTNFVNAVIDKPAFDSIKSYIDFAKESSDAEIIVGGNCDDSVGYFIEPTIILAKKSDFKTMVEEIFGPVLTVYVYDDNDLDGALKLCDESAIYALTGAVFAEDRYAIIKIGEALKNTAGNFYINDKPTGAVVGQQPFGGARASGTNDKAGSYLNLVRWMSTRTIKENFVPQTEYRYPFMDEK
jgi:1-pyrroline-5-carboxylate dehydrogenase